MTEHAKTDWNPERALAAMLDGLAEELLAAPDHEVAPYPVPSTTDDDRHDAAELVRQIIAAADADFPVLPVSRFIARGLRGFVTRSQ